MTSNGATVPFRTTSWLSVLTGGSTDGAIAYNQFKQSDNPYDPIFLKDHNGTATVEPLQVVHGKASQSQSSKPAQKPDQDQPSS